MKSWHTLFFGSFRRQPSARQYKYKNNVPLIRSAVLRNFRKYFKREEFQVEAIECSEAIERWSLESLQKLVVKDIMASQLGKTSLQLIRKNNPNDLGEKTALILKWGHVAPIFSMPLFRSYGEDSQNHRDGRKVPGKVPFELQHAIRLTSRNNSTELWNVSWPDPIYSLSCQGLGVAPHTFESLIKAEFVNPADNSLLRVYKVDFVPEGCDAIGLFPAFVESHRKPFSGLQLYGSLIRRSLCSGQARTKINNVLTRRPREASNDLKIDQAPKEVTVENSFGNLKTLLDQIRGYKLLWSTKKDKNKICPGDIIRCTLSSRHITKLQVEEEFCKNYILFSIFSQALRIRAHLEKGDASLLDAQLSLNALDILIWDKFKASNELEEPTNVQELLEYKEKYDEFLASFAGYHFAVIAEMKSLSEDFYSGDAHPRGLTVLALLSAILRSSKLIKLFNPNISTYIHEKLPEFSKGSHLDALAVTGSADAEAGELLNCIIKKCIELEHIMYADRFSSETPIQLEPVAPLTDWKFIILSKQDFSPEMTRIAQFNSRVYIQFVKDLTEVSRKNFFICKAKKMINEDTFIFLYKIELPNRLSREDLVSDIIDKLDEVNPVNSMKTQPVLV